MLLANAAGALGDEEGARLAIANAQQANPRFDVEGFRRYLLAISREVGDSVRKQTHGLVKAGLLSPLSEVNAA